MATLLARSVLMNRGFGELRTDGDFKHEEITQTASRVNQFPSHSSTWSRSPTLISKRPAPPSFTERHATSEDSRSHAIYSPTGLKRRRGDSDMSTTSPAGESPHRYGSVRITSTSIHSVVHTSDNEYGGPRRGSRGDDTGLEERASFGWRSSQGSARDSFASSLTEDDQTGAVDDSVVDGARPFVANSSRNITFPMLQEHFTKPLKDAASFFGVCTTLLKKVCRKNGIVSWPYRQIIGLQKSIASMEQQVQYFDGDQRRQYTEQLAKLHIKLDAFIRTGEAPSEEALIAQLQQDKNNRAHAIDGDSHDDSRPVHASPDHGFQRSSSVMASAVTIDEHVRSIDRAPERPRSPAYDYTAPPRPLPPISFILNQQFQASREHAESTQQSYFYDTHEQWR